MMTTMPFNGNALFDKATSGEIAADSLVTEIESTVSSSSSLPSFGYTVIQRMRGLAAPLGVIMVIVLVIVSIILLVKAIKHHKGINEKFSEDILEKIKSTSKSLIILHLIGFIGFNALSLISLIVSIVSYKIAKHSQKLFSENNFEMAKQKINNASLINIIISGATIFLAVCGWYITIIILTFINYGMWFLIH